MLIDSHCHLDYFEDNELPSIVKRASQSNVNILHTISTTISKSNQVLRIAEEYDNVYASIGIHPNDAENEKDTTLEELLILTKHKKVISIGETGLDYYYENSPRAIQKNLFRLHIEASQITSLPLIIHSRNADEDMIKILQKESNKKPFKAVMHSFSSSQELCQAALELDFYISFSGIVTFKNAHNLHEIAKSIPENRILIETDSPYLAPVPNRGKRNEPAFVVHIADQLNKLRKCTNTGEITTRNFEQLFGNFIKFCPQK